MQPDYAKCRCLNAYTFLTHNLHINKSMNDKEKEKSRNLKFGDRYDWRGQVLVYSERHGWHLRPTEPRKEEERKVSSVSKEE